MGQPHVVSDSLCPPTVTGRSGAARRPLQIDVSRNAGLSVCFSIPGQQDARDLMGD